ncbi:ergothioneine biosynthesis protein EgtB [Spartinivicinus poritis]|uniref:Ergothioneine biosynthesis protein EgtB n=1 Tax=Spartinivicinus poritis TaxID=2994640 RepID=A0ABT5UCS7_9GAMM|nr:ergothioneine biosynthesis protein EgtB [Spartinivicinus sp. A2-2]MDE1464182.1 ergothioneine biosynthesis protein EgtB [Spartinivicinus sp. A2-2]
MTNKSAVAEKLENYLEKYQTCRAHTWVLCEPLEQDDYNLQAIAETSPVKWHLAHTTWFFETFILAKLEDNFKPFHPAFHHLFNSYYNGVGKPFIRRNRHLLSRPTVDTVYSYRENVDEKIKNLLKHNSKLSDHQREWLLFRLALGIHHEQQHQELILTDLKYNFFQNPLLPRYQTKAPKINHNITSPALRFIEFPGGKTTIGYEDKGFSFDNEKPHHEISLPPFSLSNRLVLNHEYLAFIEDKGYQKPGLWLADGWESICRSGINKPLYWFQKNHEWYEYTLYGSMPLSMESPVCHISYYEADAYARWAGYRIPTEQEWEFVAKRYSHLIDGSPHSPYHPLPQINGYEINHLFNHCWQWTLSAYLPYPKFKPFIDEVGEYNGKFMCNQMVLRGGSCLTPHDHIRPTYRNFFYPKDRWQMTGIRLAS